jgi:methylated-DNA-[protein]-cysteine S-methyltransferase
VHAVVASPVGPLTLVAAGGACCALYLEHRRHPPSAALLGELLGAAPRAEDAAPRAEDAALLAEAARQLGEYFDGRRTEFDLPLALDGTPFQRTVWAELLRIPYGETVTYGELAERIGRPTAARAVGLANGRNPISIVVPCHRVVGATGGLTGYGGGIDRKRQLLEWEHHVRYGTRPITY